MVNLTRDCEEFDYGSTPILAQREAVKKSLKGLLKNFQIFKEKSAIESSGLM